MCPAQSPVHSRFHEDLCMCKQAHSQDWQNQTPHLLTLIGVVSVLYHCPEAGALLFNSLSGKGTVQSEWTTNSSEINGSVV